MQLKLSWGFIAKNVMLMKTCCLFVTFIGINNNYCNYGYEPLSSKSKDLSEWALVNLVKEIVCGDYDFQHDWVTFFWSYVSYTSQQWLSQTLAPGWGTALNISSMSF